MEHKRNATADSDKMNEIVQQEIIRLQRHDDFDVSWKCIEPIRLALINAIDSWWIYIHETTPQNFSEKPKDIDSPNALNILESINRELRQITFIANRIDMVYNQNKHINGVLEQINFKMEKEEEENV